MRSPEEEAAAKELFVRHQQQAWTDEQSSSDAFDKHLLAFATGALGLSLSFIKDIVPLKEAIAVGYLLKSWAFFTTCIIVTIFSYPVSILALKKHVVHLEKFYLDDCKEYFNRKSVWSRLVIALRFIAGICFIMGVIATVIFAWQNVRELRK